MFPEACWRNASVLMSAISRPRPTTIRWSAVNAISLIRCEETKTVRPSRCEPSQQVPHPVDSFRVEPVDGLVEHHRLRIADQRRRDPEPLPHPERELAGPLPRNLVKTDEIDQIVDTRSGNAMCLGEREQVVVGGAAGVHRSRLEERADLVQRSRVVAIPLPVDRRFARGRSVEPQDQPHRRRLSGAVRSEKPGHDAWLDGEAEPIDGSLLAVVLRQLARDDHDEVGRRRCLIPPT